MVSRYQLKKALSVHLFKAIEDLYDEARSRHSYTTGTGIGEAMKQKYPGGRWVTMNGRHVYIHNGRVVPETRPPGWSREHDIAAKNRMDRTAREDEAFLQTIREAAATAETPPKQQRGWMIIPKKGNDTYTHKDHLKTLGAQWRGTGDEEGWHIPTVFGTDHAQKVLDYAKRSGLKGAFRPDELAPSQEPNAMNIVEKLSKQYQEALREQQRKVGNPAAAKNAAIMAVAQANGIIPKVGMTMGDIVQELEFRVDVKTPEPVNIHGQLPGESWKETMERKKKEAEAEKAKGLRFVVRYGRNPGTQEGTYAVRMEGFDSTDPSHRRMRNVIKKISGSNYRSGHWILGDGEKGVSNLTELRDKFGPMLEFSEKTQAAIERHDPKFAKNIKNEGDRAAAGLAAQTVEEPLKIKSLRTKRANNDQKIKPHGYQWSGVHYLAAVEKGVLGFGTGLGKTLTSLMAAEHAVQNLGAKGPVKIVVPATRLYGWQDEINDFFKGKKVVVIDGNQKERAALYKQAKKADYVIMSYASMTNEGALIAKELPGDVAIYDEAHYLKDPKSARSKAAYEYGSPKYTWWLTATPVMNNLDEAFRAMEFMNPGVLGEKKQFVQKFAQKDDVPTMTGKIKSQVVGIKPNEEANLRKLLAPYFFMLDKKNERVKIAMPPKTESRETLGMDPYQNALYNAVRGDILAELEGQTEGGTVDMHILTKIMRLEQIAINPKLIVPIADELGLKSTNPALKAIASKTYVAPKLEEAASQIAQNWERSNEDNGGKGGKGSIIFAQSPATLNDLKEHLKNDYGFTEADFTTVTGATNKKARSEAERYFNSGKAKVILCTKAANEGMNLQQNSNLHIDLDYEWNPSSMEQRLGRGYRQGQEADFHHQQFVMRGSIEGPKIALLKRKAGIIGDLFGEDGASSTPKKGGGLTVADVYELLGADKATVDRVRASSEAALKATKEKRAARNTKAVANEAAAEAKAAKAAKAPAKAAKAPAKATKAPAKATKGAKKK